MSETREAWKPLTPDERAEALLGAMIAAQHRYGRLGKVPLSFVASLLTSIESGHVIGRCGCTIHEDRGEPCGYFGDSTDYSDPIAQVCDTCLRVCWGVS